MSACVQVSRTELDWLVGMSHRRLSVPMMKIADSLLKLADENTPEKVRSTFKRQLFPIATV
jgi:hypothetical protein